jgi:antitoxin component YwqK of YwqJK toxin-antitoxin module
LWENGRLAQRGLMVGGKCYGVWTDYHEDGHKTLEGRFGPEGKESLWCTEADPGIRARS